MSQSFWDRRVARETSKYEKAAGRRGGKTLVRLGGTRRRRGPGKAARLKALSANGRVERLRTSLHTEIPWETLPTPMKLASEGVGAASPDGITF
jgi:hypothetical protein